MAKAIHNLLLGLAVLLCTTAGCAKAQIADPDADPPPPPPVETDPQVVALLEKIEAVSSETNTLSSRVRYTRVQTLTGDEQRRYGWFYYTAATDETPTLFAVMFDRLIVDGKARRIENWFVFDGRWLLERDHDDKTATRRELVPEGAERDDTLSLGDGSMPIPLRLKADEVLKNYTVKRLEDEPFGEEQVLLHLQLKPKQAKRDTAPLDLWFDKQTLVLHKVVTMEDNDEIEMVFSKVEPNAEIKKGTFDTKLPDADDGWQVQDVPLDS
ncbi:MAG: LolA family protein [Phycisphaeraceae bacterium]